MSGKFASFMLLYNGQLVVSDSLVPTYIGGRNRLLEVPPNTSLKNLKRHVLQTLQYDVTKYTVNLTCRIPVGTDYLATRVEDQDTCRIVMRHATLQFLMLYVEIEEITGNDNMENTTAVDSRMTSTMIQQSGDIIMTDSPQHDTYLNFAGTSTQNIQRYDEQNDDQFIDHPETDESYETMSSGSSSDSSEDQDIDLDDVAIAQSNETSNDLLRNYCFNTIGLDDNMRVNNEYHILSRTTKEWDQDISEDTVNQNTSIEPDMKIPEELVEGMCFSSKEHLQFAVHGWSIVNNVEFVVKASNNKKFTAVCVQSDASAKPCQWRMHASLSKRLGGVWKLATLNKDHSCVNPILLSGHKQCTSKFISYFILPAIRSQIDLKPREIISRTEAKFNIRVSYMKAWDARRKALKAVFGSWEESYHSIYPFMNAINTAMPGSVYRIQSNRSHRFERIFWSFKPCIEGWLSCRPVLSLDGTFLLGKYRGTLLTAVGIDANNGLFPLAFAVVESECNESWFWFLRCMLETMPLLMHRENLCFISDRHSGIVRGCRELFPLAAHRFCLRHLRENFKKAIRKMGISDIEFLCQKMYQAGSTNDIRIFERQMEDIKRVKEEAYKWLMDRDITCWTLTFDNGFRYATMTTNASESFNGVLKRARGLPIQALITSIYYNIVGIFLKRRKMICQAEIEGKSVFSKTALNFLTESEGDARWIREPTRINQTEFQVFDMSGTAYRVDINANGTCECQCGKPKIYHMPCSHAISCLSVLRQSHYNYVSTYYTLQTYKATYAADFHCIPDRSKWLGFDIARGFFPLTPPNYRRRSGRPRVRRFKNTMDESSSTNRRKCRICKMAGHNSSTCRTRVTK